MRSPRTVLACLALLAASVALATPALADPVVVAPPEEHATSPVLAIDGAGDTTVAWESDRRPYRVRAALRTPVSPAFSAPLDLAPLRAEARLSALEAGPGGQTAVGWVDGPVLSGVDYWLQLRAAGASAFGAPIKVSGQGAGESVGQAGLSLTIDPQGNVTAVWVTVSAAPALAFRIQAATLAAGTTAFSPPVDIAPAGRPIRELDAAVDASGGVTAAWTRDNGARNVVQTAHRDAGDVTWSAPQDLSDDGVGRDGGTANEVHVAAGRAQSATVAWTEQVDGPHKVVQATRRVAGAPLFDAPHNLSSLDERYDAHDVRVAVDAGGEAIVAWELDVPEIVIVKPLLSAAAAGSPDRIETAWSGAGSSTFAASVVASDPTQDALQPALVAGPKGGFVLSYAEEPQDTVRLTTRGPGEASGWGPARPAAHAFNAQLAVGPDGDASILWQEDGVPKVQDLDTTPPVPDGLTVPSSAIVGQPIALSVTPHDRLSPVGTTTWSFGDGEAATGDAVTHAYGAPGRRRVTVTVADVVGNTVSVTRDVDVTDVPLDGGGSGGGGGAGGHPRPRPRITKASLSPRRVRPGRHGGPLTSRLARGTGARLRFTASEPGRLALTLARVTPGRRVSGGRCSTRARRGRRCTHVTPLARVSRRVAAGKATLLFTGRAKGRALRPGRYRMELRLTGAGGLRSTVTTIALTVRR